MHDQLDATAIKRIADILVDTTGSLTLAVAKVTGTAEEDVFRIGKDLCDEVRVRLTTDHELFECTQCGRWLSTTRIAPDKEEWCISCAKDQVTK